MDIGEYDFDGVFTELEEIPSDNIGIYVVLCLLDGLPHCVLYIGTSEGGTGRSTGPDVTKTGNLQHTLRYHDKRDCWEENTHAEIGYCTKSVVDSERRIAIRNELNWKYVTPCGTDPWDTGPQEDTSPLEEAFGPRGNESI